MKKWNRPNLTHFTADQLGSVIAAQARSICRRFFVR